MEKRIICEALIAEYETHLQTEEKSAHTIAKYLRDLRLFAVFAEGAALCKESAVAFKQRLLELGCAARSVNSMLASVNSLFHCHTDRVCFALFKWKKIHEVCRAKTVAFQNSVCYNVNR